MESPIGQIGLPDSNSFQNLDQYLSLVERFVELILKNNFF